MTPDYRRMRRDLRDLGIAALRTEARLIGRWAELVSRCGTRFADSLDARREAGAAGVAAAAGDAARDYVRGLAAMPEIAMLDLAAELDAARRAGRDP